ncbi:MAG TPA: DinB family protein [Mycobacteriales bacterium]|nr:DinB family protein [Mycobacteriales bacterium]
MTSPKHRAGAFVDPANDPRDTSTSLGDERVTLLDYVKFQRQTLELKCEGLTPEQMAQRSVPPSTMSLLGLVRHMAHVERAWFRIHFAGEDVPRLYQTPDDPDGDFDGAVADQAVVDDAWARWREEIAYADEFVATHDLDFIAEFDGNRVSLRELLVHMVEEYARHNGHADLLRECVDGRIGE